MLHASFSPFSLSSLNSVYSQFSLFLAISSIHVALFFFFYCFSSLSLNAAPITIALLESIRTLSRAHGSSEGITMALVDSRAIIKGNYKLIIVQTMVGRKTFYLLYSIPSTQRKIGACK